MTSQEPFVIAGGGVGGLTTALALAQAGQRSLLLERAPAFREVGAGLQLSPNASRILDRLKVLDALKGDAVAPEYVRLRRGSDGADLTRIPLADFGIALGRALSRRSSRRSSRRFGRPRAAGASDRNLQRFDADRLHPG